MTPGPARRRRRVLELLLVGLVTGTSACAAPPGSAVPSATAATTAASTSSSTPDPPISASPTTASPTTATAVPTTPSGPPQPFSSQPVSVGRLLLTTLHGAASGLAMRVWVWLPPQYDQPAYAHTAFPVLVLYPGGDGVSYTQWFSPEKVGIVAEGAAAGRLSPFVIVEPQLQPSESVDTECTDLDGQPKVGTFMDTDVPAMIHNTFRVAATRTGWGVGGASSGAYCATRLLFARPDLYSVGASLGGYFLIQTSLSAGRTPAAKATSPQVIAEQHPPNVRLRLYVGEKDRVSVAENQAFLAKVRPPTSVDLQVAPGGGHTWTTFQGQLPDMFAFFTATLDKAVPQP